MRILIIFVLGVSSLNTAWAECDEERYKATGYEVKREVSDACADVELPKYGVVLAAMDRFTKFKDEFAECLALPHGGRDRFAHPIGNIQLTRTFPSCPQRFQDEWDSTVERYLPTLDTEMPSIQASLDRKNYEEALTKLDYPEGHLKELESASAYFATEAQAEKIRATRAAIEDLRIKFDKARLDQIRAKPCPAGSHHNPTLEAKLGAVYDDWVSRHTVGKSERKILRMNGPVFEQSLIDRQVQTANTILCYKDLTRTVEPTCHYDWLSFSRSKPHGGSWTAWTRGGAGENGPLFCDQVK